MTIIILHIASSFRHDIRIYEMWKLTKPSKNNLFNNKLIGKQMDGAINTWFHTITNDVINNVDTISSFVGPHFMN